MNSLREDPGPFIFCFPKVDTLLRVEQKVGEVTIRATRATFSARRKAGFVSELVAEGFIPDDYRWITLSEEVSLGDRIRWVVDASWLQIDEVALARTRRIFLKALVTALLLVVVTVSAMLPNNQVDTPVSPLRKILGSHWQR